MEQASSGSHNPANGLGWSHTRHHDPRFDQRRPRRWSSASHPFLQELTVGVGERPNYFDDESSAPEEGERTGNGNGGNGGNGGSRGNGGNGGRRGGRKSAAKNGARSRRSAAGQRAGAPGRGG